MTGSAPSRRRAALTVTDAGLLTTIQDRGRAGFAHQGVPPSGAADLPAYELANRLVGNPPDAAALETTLRGPGLRLEGDAVRHMALTGAPAPLRVGGRPAPIGAPVAVRPGQSVQVGTASSGLRSYLAFNGGIDIPPELGSRSTDLLSGLGPRPVQAGDRLELGPVPGPVPAVDAVPQASTAGGELWLDMVPGPRADWLTATALDDLWASDWKVTETSNRIGLRLDGPDLAWSHREELLPEGIVTGALQIPPRGRPVLFLNDHPVTGGYPVVGVVVDDSLPLAAQARPGTVLRFLAVH